MCPSPNEIIRDVFGEQPPVDLCVKVTIPDEGIFKAKTGRLRAGFRGLFFLLIGGYQHTLYKGGIGWSDQFEVAGGKPTLTSIDGKDASWYLPNLPKKK
jgi:hypothetical protein